MMISQSERAVFEREMISYFKDLLSIDTSNPPGNETAASEYIASVFKREGIEYDLFEPVSGRGSIIARIPGSGGGSPLLLMSHLDVVGADSEQWDYPPFGGCEAEGFLWGRGALDCKNTVVLWMMIMLLIKRLDLRPCRDLIFMAAADEEAGGTYGTRWIVDNHFDLIRAGAAFNEGGGAAIGMIGHVFYTYQSGEKGNIWLRITARGRPGHGSVPRHDNPVAALAGLLVKFKQMNFPFTVTNTVKEMVRAISSRASFPKNYIVKAMLNPLLSNYIIKKGIMDADRIELIRSMLRNTLCPTVIKAGRKVNVIPSEGIAEVDMRILPGNDPLETLDSIQKKIGPDFDIEVLDIQHPTESPVNHPVVDSIRRVLRRHNPGATLIPILLPAASDATFLRRKGVDVYGFSPLLPGEPLDCIHGNNERISVDSVRFSLLVGFETVIDYIL